MSSSSRTTSRLLSLKPLSFLSSITLPKTHHHHHHFHTTTLNQYQQQQPPSNEDSPPYVDKSPSTIFSSFSLPTTTTTITSTSKKPFSDDLPLLKDGGRKVGGTFDGKRLFRDPKTGAKVEVVGWDEYHYLRKKADPEQDKYGLPDELKYMTPNFNASHKKLRFIGNQITGKPIDEAIRQLNFSSKLSAETIVAYLKKARQLGVEVRKWNPELMIVQQAFAGKGPKFQKEIRIHAKGRFGIMEHPTAHMRFVIKEKTVEADYGLGTMPKRARGQLPTRKVWTSLTDDIPIRNKEAVKFYNW